MPRHATSPHARPRASAGPAVPRAASSAALLGEAADATSTPPRNVEVAAAFDEIADLLEVQGANPFRIRAYRSAARTLSGLREEVCALLAQGHPLDELPGVGNKTASVVLNELGVEPAIAVDTHVFRVSHRLGLVDADATTPDKVERQLMAVIPKKWLTRAHHWLILHGRYVCTARNPKCLSCIVSDLCPKIGL